MPDFYRVLGIERSASPEDIKRAYRRLARRYHPDVNPGDPRAELQFKRLSEAYDVLADPARREEYDRFGYLRGGGAGANGFDSASGTRSTESGIRDLFSDLFRNAQGGVRDEAKGADLNTTIDLSFLDAAHGLTTRILVRREVRCTACEGRGAGVGSRRERCVSCSGTGKTGGRGLFRSEPKPCPACKGLGTREDRACSACQSRGVATLEETLTVKIPAGVDNGARVRVPAKGNAGGRGTVPGDLYVITRVAPHPHFERQGDNLYLKVPVSIPEAVLGTRISVPTIDGDATIKVPQGTNSGQKFRLAGRGIASLRTGQRGDQFVEVQVVVPRLQDERSREIMREFARLNSEDPRKGLFD